MSTVEPRDQRHSYVPRSEIDFDDYSELGPDDSASQIGRVHNSHDPGHHQTRHSGPPRTREKLGESYARQWMNGMSQAPAARPYSRPEAGNVPSSRPTSVPPSRIITPTTLVSSKRDRVRYSWQSVDVDEANRPRIHVVKIVSNTATASAALPGGEVFGFSISNAGRRIACYNSARLFILQAAALPVNISQEYALRRRPLAVEVVDEGGTLAILADEHTINVYDLTSGQVRRLKTLKTDYPTSTIALSSTGGLLAAAYEGGVEVFSLGPNALSTHRRAARSAKMDKLQFSEDGSTLVGTTTRIDAAATVYISVPVFPAGDSGIPTHEELKDAWCSNMLEPVNVLDSSHATFLRERTGPNNEKLFAWNAAEDTFGVLNTQDLQYSNVDFPVTILPPLSTCGGLGAAIHSLPTLDERGEAVGMIVNDRTVRLYMVPQMNDENAKLEAHSVDHELDEEFGCPFTDIRWVHSSANLPAPHDDPSQVNGRLVIVSPGGVVDPALAEDAVADLEQGRIIIVDFDPQYSSQPGQTFTFTLGKAPPQALDEEVVDVAQEAALVRRRTVNASQKIGQRAPTIGRTASVRRRAANRAFGSVANGPLQDIDRLQVQRRESGVTEQSPGLHDLDEISEGAEEPRYGNHTLSVVSLQRAATAVTSHRVQTRDERAAELRSVERESFVPAPEYTEEAIALLPSLYRDMAGLPRAAVPHRPDATPHLMNGMTTRSTQDCGPSCMNPDSPRATPTLSHHVDTYTDGMCLEAVSLASPPTATIPTPQTFGDMSMISAPPSPVGTPGSVRAPVSHLNPAPVAPITSRPLPAPRIESRAEIQERVHGRLAREREDLAAARNKGGGARSKQAAVEVEKGGRKKAKQDRKGRSRDEPSTPRTRFESRVNANYKVQLQQAAKTKQLRRDAASVPNLLDIASGGPDPAEILESDIEPSKRRSRWGPEMIRSQSLGLIGAQQAHVKITQGLHQNDKQDGRPLLALPADSGVRRHSAHGSSQDQARLDQGQYLGEPASIGKLSTFGGNQVRPTSAPAGPYDRVPYMRTRKKWWGGGGGGGGGGGVLVGLGGGGGASKGTTKRWRQDGTWTVEHERRCSIM